MRPLEARLISPSSIQKFHSTSGTRISAFGNALLLSAISRPFTWSAWKCEITTTSMLSRSMPAAARLALSVPRSPLLCGRRGLAVAGVEQHALAAGRQHDRRIGVLHLVGRQARRRKRSARDRRCWRCSDSCRPPAPCESRRTARSPRCRRSCSDALQPPSTISCHVKMPPNMVGLFLRCKRVIEQRRLVKRTAGSDRAAGRTRCGRNARS